MTSKVCSKNKEKKAKRKNSVKNRPNREKRRYKETEKKQRVESGFSARARNSLTTAPQ